MLGNIAIKQAANRESALSMSYLRRSNRLLNLDMTKSLIFVGLFFGIFLPYVPIPIFGSVINLPWSLIYGLLPFLAGDLLGSLLLSSRHYLTVIGAILSPFITTFLVLRLSMRFKFQQRIRLVIAIFVMLALATVPASFAFESLPLLPVYQRYVSF